MIAPRIEQGGNVQVNGSAAYVGRRSRLTMTMNQGLFDIQVPIDGGTADANGIVHTGNDRRRRQCERVRQSHASTWSRSRRTRR